MIEGLDHVNLRTAQLDAMVEWYTRILRLTPGPRPPFSFDGAWLYAREQAVVHLVAVETGAPPATDLALEHAAFRAKGLEDFLARLRDAGETHRVVRVPDMPIVQINVWDPDGNHLHIDFHSDEADAAGLA